MYDCMLSAHNSILFNKHLMTAGIHEGDVCDTSRRKRLNFGAVPCRVVSIMNAFITKTLMCVAYMCNVQEFINLHYLVCVNMIFASVKSDFANYIVDSKLSREINVETASKQFLRCQNQQK
ncbi:hypothetical protein NQ317_007503 [Molorchus minor]|uniref:Uncharacterized protein n=1 Tax=Molorchus minor TaxID=1323400 RepID=A0ABQ9J6K3_9CUCU|nr:hypothetical protein NQ317_007503 [Molorchus minor]